MKCWKVLCTCWHWLLVFWNICDIFEQLMALQCTNPLTRPKDHRWQWAIRYFVGCNVNLKNLNTTSSTVFMLLYSGIYTMKRLRIFTTSTWDYNDDIISEKAFSVQRCKSSSCNLILTLGLLLGFLGSRVYSSLMCHAHIFEWYIIVSHSPKTCSS